ncbi:hypothetical protein [Streptomyces avermitilis]|uniref:hypothetical protein n=1 Tax=Streptomyces avermitilis TaxID=33903 RepID=UPI00381112F7
MAATAPTARCVRMRGTAAAIESPLPLVAPPARMRSNRTGALQGETDPDLISSNTMPFGRIDRHEYRLLQLLTSPDQRLSRK